MLNGIIAFSLRNRSIVLVAAVFIAVYGLYLGMRRPIDVLPDINRPTVTVMTEAHGMISEDVERLVTWPLEQVLSGAGGVTRIRSSSGTGLSVVYIEFEWSQEIYLARQIVAEKLQLALPNMPKGVHPTLTPVSSILGQIQIAGFRIENNEISQDEVRKMTDRDLRPRLQSIGGVAQVVTIGGQPVELQVTVDLDKANLVGIALSEIETAILKSNLNATGSPLRIGAKGPLVSVAGWIGEPQDLARTVVRTDGLRPVRIEDVATVTFGPAALRTGNAGIDGAPGVLIVVTKQLGADTVSVTEAIKRELEVFRPALPKGVTLVADLFEQAAFIHRAIDNVKEAVRDGAILVTLVLFAFLMNLRTTFITLTAIPLSVAIAAIVFAIFGLTINTMTLGGLAVAIGTLVDDAIVDVENVFRRLHENGGKTKPLPILQVVYNASSEVRKPVVYGTFLVTVVYLPLFFLQGIEGRLFAPIGLAYIVSVLSSLLVAMTVTPVLCYYLLGMRSIKNLTYGGRLISTLKSVFAHAIRFSIRYPMPLAGFALTSVLCCGYLMLQQGSTFLPEFNEGTAQVNLILPPDTGLEASDRIGKRLEEVLIKVEGVSSVGRRTGRAPGDEHAMPVSVTEAIINFDTNTNRTRTQILEDIRHKIAEEFPGIPAQTEQPLAHLISHLLSGVNAQVAIKIFGPDLDVLREAAREAEQVVASIKGVRDLYVEPQVMIDQIQIVPDRAAMAQHGVTIETLARTIELAMGGEAITGVQLDQLRYAVTLSIEPEQRAHLDQLRKLYLEKEGGERVILSDVASVRLTKTPSNINRENTQRRMVVQHNVAGRSLSEVVADVETALLPLQARLASMSGYTLRIGGQFQAQREATRTILLLSFAALAIMFSILYLHFRSYLFSLLVLIDIPAAFIGAAIYILFTNQTLSVATLVGLIALGGIAARNGILLFDHYLHLMREECMSFSEETIVRAGLERMVPVLMTALTSGIGLIPLALSPDQPGKELLYPVATAIIGGLISSTLLDFLLRPGLFYFLGRKEAERLVSNSKSTDNSIVLAENNVHQVSV